VDFPSIFFAKKKFLTKMTNVSELENLAKAEIRIRNLISKERQSFQDFVQAATEFHKPGLTQTKQELDSVQAGLTDIQQASVQKALSKVPDATPAADAPATQTTIKAQIISLGW
jgi:hypothetical protein